MNHKVESEELAELYISTKVQRHGEYPEMLELSVMARCEHDDNDSLE